MESASPLSRCVPQNSKKRMFPGESSRCMEGEDVVEISPPPRSNRGSKSKSRKQKVIFPEIIDVDLDEDCGVVVLTDEKVFPSCKGKEVMHNNLSDPGGGMTEGSIYDVLLSNNCTMGIDNAINVDDFGSDSFFGDDKYADAYFDDIIYDDEYSIFLQSHFDRLDIPIGVEATVPQLSGHTANRMKASTEIASNKSFSKSKLDNVGLPSALDSSLCSWALESKQVTSTPGSSSMSGTPFSSVGQTQSSTWSFPKPAQPKSNLTTASGFTYLNSQLKDPVNLSSVEKLPKLFQFHSSSHLENKPLPADAISFISSQTDSPIGASYTPISIEQHHADTQFWSNLARSTNEWQGTLNVTVHAGGTSWGPQPSNGSSTVVHVFPKDTACYPVFNDPVLAASAAATSEVSSLSSSTKIEDGNPDELMKRFQLFKNFDTVQDFSDHYYYKHGSSVKQPTKNWTKKIQDEWKILEKDLPDTVFVRVYESRMDLLRAVILGAEGTPYHDGLFFFDVFFPSNYPNVPPKVHYHSGGLRINPNLYNCGKVCLSLLNTWGGSQKEKWIPRKSTMLQVLVSIQGLILNAKPYFNEPGYASMSGSISGEQSSLQYSERTFILSLKTMVYNMRRPPKYFEDFVAGHFRKRAHDILIACQAYIDGAQVGCLVKGGIQDVDEGDKSCSQVFRHDVASFINTLVDAFKQVGAKDCEKFLPLAQKANGVRPEATYPA